MRCAPVCVSSRVHVCLCVCVCIQTTEGDQLDATQQVDEVDVDDSAGADLAENEAANVNTSNINLGLLKVRVPVNTKQNKPRTVHCV